MTMSNSQNGFHNNGSQNDDARDRAIAEPAYDPAILIDSADEAEVSEAVGLGFVSGVTTNPTLMRKVTGNPLKHAERLLETADVAEFYYQPCGAYSSILDEAVAVWSLDPQRVIIKLPATRNGVLAAAQLGGKDIRTALTAAQTPTAMIVAETVGCAAVIPYVDRAWRDLRVGNDLIRQLADIRRRGTRILAASVKNIGQFTQAFSDGADAVSAPLSVLRQLLSHPAVLEAEESLIQEYRGSKPLDANTA